MSVSQERPSGYAENFFPSQRQQERLGPWLPKQVQFLKTSWLPKLQSIGLNRDETMRLWMKWFKPVGSVFKETKVEEAEFFQRLQIFLDSMTGTEGHLQKLKWFLHAPDWKTVVDAIETASDPELTFLMKSEKTHVVTIDSGNPQDDKDDEVRDTLYDVYLPSADQAGESRIRVEFPVRGPHLQEDVMSVTNHITRDMHNKMRFVATGRLAA